jgi:pyruvate, orthophosphate dikinase
MPSERRSTQVHRIPAGAELPPPDVVGTKARNLMIMAQHALPVPPGFVLATELCRAYLVEGRKALATLESVLSAELARLAEMTGRRFGDAKRPLLVSVRSGAAVSMPGMMETVLNVGLTDTAMRGLIRLTGNPRLAFDCRRRLIAQYAEVVHGAPARPFEDIVTARLAADRLCSPHELDTEALQAIVEDSLAQFESTTGQAFPEEPIVQLVATVEAVLKSWSSERAKAYRRLNGIDDKAGTATLVQCMVFGNSGPLSGSGVGFTRNPADGSNAVYIDYLPSAQGEDVVAGRRNVLGADALEVRAPSVFAELMAGKTVLERTFRDAQDFEFTVEDGRLYLLQCRSAKRTPLAALRIASDLVAEKLIEPKEALTRLEGLDIDAIEVQGIDTSAAPPPIAKAVPASVGVVAGLAVLDPARLDTYAKRGKPLVLLREFAETVDVEAVAKAAGLVTAKGARTSHAAVVARQLGKVCLVGCAGLEIAADGRSARLEGDVIAEGDALTIDGATGAIYRGELAVVHRKPDALVKELRRWRRSH